MSCWNSLGLSGRWADCRSCEIFLFIPFQKLFLMESDEQSVTRALTRGERLVRAFLVPSPALSARHVTAVRTLSFHRF